MAIEFAGVEAEVASQLRLDINKPDQKTLVDRWINLTLENIHGRADWFWARDRQIVQTVIDKTDGTVDVALASTTVAGTSTAFAAADVGKYIQFSNNDDWYKITAVASTGSLTMESPFNGTAALDDATYTIRQFYYAIPSAEKVITVKQWQTPRKLSIRHVRDFDMDHPGGDSTGGAEDFFVWGINSSNQLQFLVYPWPDTVRNLEIRYKKKCTEDSIAYFPEKWRDVIVDGALVRGLRYISVGNATFNPVLIDKQEGVYERGVARMLVDSEPESDSAGVVQSCEEAVSPLGPELPADYA